MHFDTYGDALAFLFEAIDYEKLTRYKYDTQGFNLGRVERLMSCVGSPHRGLAAVHVAGTKGKGSTAAMIVRFLEQAGMKVGLFTSPHLVHLEERITVNGEMIGRDDVCSILERLGPYLERERRDNPLLAPTFFEIITALAFTYFRDTGVDWAVLETGMGGRLDATNVVKPRVSVITSIGFDHTDKLGGTLEQIAGEKAGIIKEGVPVVSSPQADEARRCIEEKCVEKRARLYLVGRDIEIIGLRHLAQEGILCGIKTWKRTYNDLRLPLLGGHQAENLASALGAIEVLADGGGFPWDEKMASDALRGLRCPARVEVVSGRPLIVLDTAHNVSSMRALAGALREAVSFERLILVMGVSIDKDLEGMFGEVVPMAYKVVLTAARMPRAAPPDLLAEKVKAYLGEGVEALAVENAHEAMRLARKFARPDDCICVTGSFYLAGEIKELLEREGA